MRDIYGNLEQQQNMDIDDSDSDADAVVGLKSVVKKREQPEPHQENKTLLNNRGIYDKPQTSPLQTGTDAYSDMCQRITMTSQIYKHNYINPTFLALANDISNGSLTDQQCHILRARYNIPFTFINNIVNNKLISVENLALLMYEYDKYNAIPIPETIRNAILYMCYIPHKYRDERDVARLDFIDIIRKELEYAPDKLHKHEAQRIYYNMFYYCTYMFVLHKAVCAIYMRIHNVCTFPRSIIELKYIEMYEAIHKDNDNSKYPVIIHSNNFIKIIAADTIHKLSIITKSLNNQDPDNENINDWSSIKTMCQQYLDLFVEKIRALYDIIRNEMDDAVNHNYGEPPFYVKLKNFNDIDNDYMFQLYDDGVSYNIPHKSLSRIKLHQLKPSKFTAWFKYLTAALQIWAEDIDGVSINCIEDVSCTKNPYRSKTQNDEKSSTRAHLKHIIQYICEWCAPLEELTTPRPNDSMLIFGSAADCDYKLYKSSIYERLNTCIRENTPHIYTIDCDDSNIFDIL